MVVLFILEMLTIILGTVSRSRGRVSRSTSGGLMSESVCFRIFIFVFLNLIKDPLLMLCFMFDAGYFRIYTDYHGLILQGLHILRDIVIRGL